MVSATTELTVQQGEFKLISLSCQKPTFSYIANDVNRNNNTNRYHVAVWKKSCHSEMESSVSQKIWIKPCFARWVHPIKCIPGDRCREVREWNCDCFPLMSLHENKQKAFVTLLSWGEYKLTQQSASLYQLARGNGRAYSPKQCSSNTDRNIMHYKLWKLAKWNICSACLSTEARSRYEFPLHVLDVVMMSWEWVWKVHLFPIKKVHCLFQLL